MERNPGPPKIQSGCAGWESIHVATILRACTHCENELTTGSSVCQNIDLEGILRDDP